MGKQSRRRRAALLDAKLQQMYPGLNKYQRNPHFRHNIKKEQQAQKVFQTTMKLIKFTTAEIQSVEEQKGMMSNLKELHRYLPTLPTEMCQTANRVSKWIRQSALEPTVVCLDGDLKTAREAAKVWPPQQPSTPERPSEPIVSIHEASPITRHNLEGLRNRCNDLETQRFRLKRQVEEDRLRRQGLYLETPKLTRKQQRCRERAEKWSARKQLFTKSKTPKRLVHLVLPIQPPMPPAQPYGGGYGADIIDHPSEGNYQVSVSEGQRVVRKEGTPLARSSPLRTSVLPTIVEETPGAYGRDQLYDPERPTTLTQPHQCHSEVASVRDDVLSFASETNVFAETLL